MGIFTEHADDLLAELDNVRKECAKAQEQVWFERRIRIALETLLAVIDDERSTPGERHAARLEYARKVTEK